MENGVVLFVTFFLCLVVIIFFYGWLHKRKKEHLSTIDADWVNFKQAITNKHIDGIVKFGNKVVWNEHFTMEKLKEMSRLIHNLESVHPELKTSQKLENLKSVVYNKYIKWNMKYPYHTRQY
ncbi:hypothetical protein [Tenacibaculum sp. M341]|uniref:hypothetical protein n=1 Tax=Tenacibaculum sp. M341 TaxID=2530339 RepID=UPI0010466BCC|nr:hypothetical protein [Tenacibaculum sp. M341]TCI84866.1 hypothetical protein EYW44_19205 [Tenacibaculum sp. M341]